MKRILALLLLLCLCGSACAEPAQGFTLRFQVEETAPALKPAAELLNMLQLSGAFVSEQDAGALRLRVRLNGVERASADFLLQRSGDKAVLTSPLLGEERLMLNLPALLEFCLKMRNHLGLPLHYAALLLPQVTTNALQGAVDACRATLFASEGTRTVPMEDLLALCRELERLCWDDPSLSAWLTALDGDTEFAQLITETLAALPEWLEAHDDGRGLQIVVKERGDSWWLGEQVLFTTNKWGWRLRPGELDVLGLASLYCDYTDNGWQLNASLGKKGALLSLRLDWAETDGIEAELRVSGSYVEGIPLPRATDSGIGLNPLGEGEQVRLRFTWQGEELRLYADGQLLIRGQLTLQRDDSLTLPGALDYSSALNLFSLQDDTLAPFVRSVAKPLVKGLLPLAAQAPASTCAALMDLLEQAGIFSLDKVEDAD